MKIQRVTPDHHARVYALLRAAFPGSDYEAELVQAFHAHDTPIQEWVCLQTNKAIAYLTFSNAYRGREVCGLHLAPMAVAPDFQKQGVGTELLQFALRQEPIRSQPLYVLGEPGYYRRFGFAPCAQPICPFDRNNAHFLSLRNPVADPFVIGYVPEFKPVIKAPKPKARKRR
jgi:putative acetyltransferase